MVATSPLNHSVGEMFDENDGVPQGRKQRELVSALNEQVARDRYVKESMLKLAEVAYQQQRQRASSGEGE